MERILNILLVLSASFLFLVVLRRVLFRRGSRGNVPTAEKVRAHLDSMSQESIETVRRIRIDYHTDLSPEAFSTLCVATALSIEQPISALGEKIVLSQYLDSLSLVEYVVLLEELFDILVADENAGKLRTFRKVVDYVSSAVTE